jgi:hypothetical protein
MFLGLPQRKWKPSQFWVVNHGSFMTWVLVSYELRVDDMAFPSPGFLAPSQAVLVKNFGLG